MNRAAALALSTFFLGACSGGGAADAGYWTIGSGTLTGTTVSASVSGAKVYFTELGADAGYALQLELGTLTFGVPADAPDPRLTSTITITDAPVTTTYDNTSSDVCGGLEVDTDGSAGTKWQAAAMASCSGINHSGPIGIWTLKLTQLSRASEQPADGGTGYLTPHGTLDGTMSDGAAGHAATLQLSFP